VSEKSSSVGFPLNPVARSTVRVSYRQHMGHFSENLVDHDIREPGEKYSSDVSIGADRFKPRKPSWFISNRSQRRFHTIDKIGGDLRAGVQIALRGLQQFASSSRIEVRKLH
jgi:hypothetical protein